MTYIFYQAKIYMELSFDQWLNGARLLFTPTATNKAAAATHLG